MKKIVMLLLAIFIFSFVGYSTAQPFFVWPKGHQYDTPVKKRVAAAYMLEKACNEHLGWNPVVKADGVDKKLLVFESIRLTGPMSYYLVYEEKFGARAREVGFDYIYFIRHRYNEKEFDGWTFNVNMNRFE